MAGIRHFTASAIVLDDRDRVLLVHHNKLGQRLYPGGHIDPDEDPAEAAVREVAEETGIRANVISDHPFEHPAVRVIPPPFAILEMDVTDTRIGPHRHIDMATSATRQAASRSRSSLRSRTAAGPPSPTSPGCPHRPRSRH